MNKHKYILLGFLLCIVAIVLLGLVNIKINSNRTIYIKEVSSFDEKINLLNTELEKVSDDDKKQAIENLITRIKDTYYTENISVKDYYENYYKNNTSFYEMFLDVLDICGIDDKDKYLDDLIVSRTFPEEIKSRYVSSYEFRFIDYINYKSVYEISDNVGSYTSKEYEIISVSNLLKEVNNEESI